jgi:hypothetical protein
MKSNIAHIPSGKVSAVSTSPRMSLADVFAHVNRRMKARRLGRGFDPNQARLMRPDQVALAGQSGLAPFRQTIIGSPNPAVTPQFQ